MKKIVINKCFGGFCLSLEGQKRYLELKGKKAYFFRMNIFGPYIPFGKDDSDLFISTYTVPNPNDFIEKDINWSGMSDKEKDEYNKKYKKISFYSGDLKRDDPILVRVVEELGEKANGRYAELKIVEIPNNVKYTIEEYDGLEHIAEKHRTWE